MRCSWRAAPFIGVTASLSLPTIAEPSSGTCSTPLCKPWRAEKRAEAPSPRPKCRQLPCAILCSAHSHQLARHLRIAIKLHAAIRRHDANMSARILDDLAGRRPGRRPGGRWLPAVSWAARGNGSRRSAPALRGDRDKEAQTHDGETEDRVRERDALLAASCA